MLYAYYCTHITDEKHQEQTTKALMLLLHPFKPRTSFLYILYSHAFKSPRHNITNMDRISTMFPFVYEKNKKGLSVSKIESIINN